MNSFRKAISDALLMIGWALLIFAISRMYMFARFLDSWEKCSSQYYRQEVPGVVGSWYSRPEEVRDATLFSEASEKIILHDVVKSIGGSPYLTVSDPILGAGILCLIMSHFVGRSRKRTEAGPSRDSRTALQAANCNDLHSAPNSCDKV